MPSVVGTSVVRVHNYLEGGIEIRGQVGELVESCDTIGPRRPRYLYRQKANRRQKWSYLAPEFGVKDGVDTSDKPKRGT